MATVGYFIALWPIGLDILEPLNIADKVKHHGKHIPGMHVYDETGDELTYIDFTRFADEYGTEHCIDRAHLHRYLRECQDTETRMDTTIQDLHQETNGVHVTFNDSTEDTYDMVIGADGIHSRVRNLIYPDVQPRYLGMTSWIIWVPESFPAKDEFLNVMGNGKAFAMYTTDEDGHWFGYFAMTAPPDMPDPVDERAANLRNHFSDMGGIVNDVLDHVPDDPEDIFHHDHEQIDVKRWRHGNVGLLGDAAHALSPLMGLGPSMAMEDAYVLADEIRNGGVAEDILKRYEQRRHPRVKSVQDTAAVFDTLMGTELPTPLHSMKKFATKTVFKHYYLNRMEHILNNGVLN